MTMHRVVISGPRFGIDDSAMPIRSFKHAKEIGDEREDVKLQEK